MFDYISLVRLPRTDSAKCNPASFLTTINKIIKLDKPVPYDTFDATLIFLYTRKIMVNGYWIKTFSDEFRTLIANTVDGVLVVDMNGRILDANDSYCRMMGYSQEELANQHISHVDLTENIEDVSKRIAEVTQKGSLRFETQHRHKNGSGIDIEVSANYSASNGGTLISFNRDISEQKRTRRIIDARLRLMEYSLTHTMDELLRQTLDEVENLTGSCVGFYHFLDSDQQMLSLHSWSTRTVSQFCKAEGTGSHYHISQAGVWADCVRERRPVIHNDYATLAHRKGMPDGHAEVVRELVVPVFRKGNIVAILGIGNKPTDYDQRDVELVTLLADLAFGVVEHKQFEESNRYLSEIMKNISEGVNLVRADSGVIVFANSKFEKMLGYDPGEMIGKDISIINAPNNKTPVETKNTIMSILSESGEWHGEVENVTKDGTHIWCYASVSAFDSIEFGKVFLTVHNDITHRKQTVEALRKSEELFRSLAECSPVGIYQTDADGNCTYVNKKWCELTGLNNDEAMGTGWSRALHPEDRENIYVTWNESVRTNRIFALEYRFLTQSGKVNWVSGVASPLKSESNEIIGYVGIVTDITERKLAEIDLKHSHELMSYIIRYNQSALAVHDKDMRYLYVSQRYIDDYKVKDSDIIGKHHYDVFPDLPQKWRDVHKRVLAGEVISEKEDSYEREDGSVDWTRWECRPWFEADGTIGGIIIYTEVITERKRAEEKLKKRQQRLDFLLSRTPAVIYTCRYNGDYGATFVSENVQKLTGSPASDFIADSSFWASHIHPDDSERVFKGLTALQTHGHHSHEYRFCRQDGTYCWMHDENQLLFDGSGNPTEIIGFWIDITERKQSEIALLESEERYRKFSQLTTDFVHRCQRSPGEPYRIKWVGGAVEKITGYSQDEIFDKGCWLPLVHPDDRQRISDMLLRLVPGNTSKNEFRIISKSGEVCWLHESLLCEAGDEPGELVLYGTSQDITDKKRAEEEHQVLEKQLQQTQRLESLGVLAGGIAHDFNNILAIIMGHCSLTEMDYDKAPDHIPEIEKAASRAADLCRQMLAYAGKAQFVQAQVNIGELVEEMVKMLKSTIKQNVVLIPSIATDIPSIKADASQIRQVAMNLIINGAEAIGETQGEVRVTLSKILIKAGQSEKDYLGKIIPAGWYACLTVTDTGCGMSDETYNRIFEPFYTTKFTGRGLGLSAVLGIITSQGGALQLSSQLGKGTTFKVYLPIQISSSNPEEAETVTDKKDTWQGSGIILLVEDEEQILQVAKAMLEELGFRVIESRNGKEAIEQYQMNANEISLVLTDMGMPVMDGYSLFRELKQRNPALPIIISSGFGDTDITSRIPRADIAGLVGKPYNFKLLREVLKNAFARR
jgi:PAS domain S-box-containing protein